MTATDPLRSLRQKALRHAFEDGALDLVAGFFTLVVALGTQRPLFLALAGAYLTGLVPFWRSLHDSLTTRRTGFAEVPGNPARLALSVVLIAGCLTMGVVAAATLASGGLLELAGWPTWAPLLSGAILAGGLVCAAVATGFTRYHVLAAVSFGASLFFWLFPFGPSINPSDRLTLSLFVTAAALSLTGAGTIVRFLRTRPVATEAASSAR